MSQPVVRWVVAQGADVTLETVLRQLGPHGVGALAEGRVFVDGRRRIDADFALTPGSVVEVHRAREAAVGLGILAEHAGFVFVDKPPGIATEPDHSGVEASVVARVAATLGVPLGELHALSRLDVGVSGVVTLARSREARDRAQELRARGAWLRRYVALASGAPEPAVGTWTEALARPHGGRSSRGEARSAETRYAAVATARVVAVPGRKTGLSVQPTLLALSPVTGRTHQLRLHAAHAGSPLLGDATYGGPARLASPNGAILSLERIALHAAWVELELDGRRLRVTAPWPADLEALWRELGGHDGDWSRAFDAAL